MSSGELHCRRSARPSSKTAWPTTEITQGIRDPAIPVFRLQLDENQAAAFWPLYNRYDVEQSKLGDQKLALIQDYAKDFLSMTDAKADQLARRALELDDRVRLCAKNITIFSRRLILPFWLCAFFSWRIRSS